MSLSPVSIGPDATMQEAAALMLRRRLNRLMVTDNGSTSGQLIGIVSSSDVVRLALCGDDEKVVV